MKDANVAASEEVDNSNETTGCSVENLSKPPSLEPTPFIGGTKYVLQEVRSGKDPLPKLDEFIQKHGDIFRMKVLNREICYCAHPDHLQEVLVDAPWKYRNPDQQFGIQDIAQEGLIALQDDRWRRVREVCNEAFTARQVQKYSDVMIEETVDRIGEWEDGKTINLWEEMEYITTSIMGRTLFGKEMEEAATEMRELRKQMVQRYNSWDYMVPKWIPTKQNRKYNQSIEEFYDVIDRMIELRAGQSGYGDDLLGMLLEARDEGRLTDQEVRDQIFIIFFPDQTAGTAATYSVFLSQTHPEVRETLEEEADALGADPRFGDLSEIPYTQNVMKETLRRYPSSYEVSREPNQPVELGGYRIEEGTLILLSHLYTHNDPRWWDDPREFRPDRWENDDLPRKSMAWAPFGGGPRACIANRYVRLELRMILAAISRRYRLEPAPGQSTDMDSFLTYSINLRPDGPVNMVVRERDAAR